MRKFIGSPRAQTGASMTTEYQDRFLPPHYYKAVVSTAAQKNHYHPLRGTSNDTSPYRLFYVVDKHPRKAPQLKALQAPPVQQRCSSAPHAPAGPLANTSQLEDYTSVYKNDFREWNTDQHRRYHRGPAQTDANAKAVPQQNERPPFEGITSYRSHYVVHPLPPRARKKTLGRQTNKVLPLDPAPSVTKHVPGHESQESSDGASELRKHFHAWSLKTSRGKAQASADPADLTLLSTTHAHYTAHECHHSRPILPPVNPGGKSKRPFQATTTTREDYRAWDTPRPVPVRTDDVVRGAAPAHSSGPYKLHLKCNETAVCNAAKRPERTQTRSTSRGTEEPRMCGSTCSDRGVTRSEGGDHKE